MICLCFCLARMCKCIANLQSHVVPCVKQVQLLELFLQQLRLPICSFAGIPEGATTALQVGCFNDSSMQTVINAKASRQKECDVKTGEHAQHL